MITRDERGRLHSDTGPACGWDGWGVYAVHGVRVQQDVIEHPELITIARIEAENNAEVRRVMISRYGQVRYLRDCGAEKIHTDECGTLWRKTYRNDEPIIMVEVLNSTPEPDGSTKTYFLRVNPTLRPMLAGQRFGVAQTLTARNAIASTFGLTGEEYHPEVET